MQTRPFMLTLLVGTLSLPGSLTAQFDAIGKLFEEVHSVTLFGQASLLNTTGLEGDSHCIFGDDVFCGAGTEVLIDIGENDEGHFELGLGAGYLGGLAGKNGTLDLRAGLRTLPTISMYYTGIKVGRSNSFAELYAGGGIGLVELVNAQAYDTARVEYGVKASTFEIGPSFGVYVGKGPVGVFAEGSYRWRRFSSLDYTFAEDVDTLPARWPRSLDLSGWSVSLGIQVRIKPDDEVFGSAGVWSLARVDAQPLPAVINAASRDGRVRQTQLLFGILTLQKPVQGAGDATYVLELFTREATVNADGEVQSLEPPRARLERGIYRVTDGQLILDPNGQADPAAYPAIRTGSEIRIRDSETGYGLVFQKSGPKATGGKAESGDDKAGGEG